MTGEIKRYRRWLLMGGGTVGIGFGAILDVIVFHLIFQHHHLLSGYIDPHSYDGLRENILYDGLFLALMFGVLLFGLVFLWRTVNGVTEQFSGVYLGGSILVGAGIFNVFDGIVNHYVLDLHNVVHNTEAWNPYWVAVSVVLLGLGGALLYWSDGPTHADSERV